MPLKIIISGFLSYKNLIITLSVLLSANCSFLGKKISERKSGERKIASVNYDYSGGSAAPQQRTPKTKRELIKMIQNGDFVVSKVLYVKGGKACLHDVRGQRNLVPGFAKPAPRNFTSAVRFQTNFPRCNAQIGQKLALISQRSAMEGTQVAALPAAAAAAVPVIEGTKVVAGAVIKKFIIPASIGCAISALDAITDESKKSPTSHNVINSTVLAGGVEANKHLITKYKPGLPGFKMAGIKGGAAGVAGYVACEGARYIYEKVDNLATVIVGGKEARKILEGIRYEPHSP